MYAGDAAVAENAAVVATNPALMTFFLNSLKFPLAVFMFRPNIDLKGTALGQFNADANDIATKVLPYIYAVYPINDDVFVVNFGSLS